MIRGEILSDDGSWQPAEFLVDTGADCTVLSAATLVAVNLPPLEMPGRLGGLGGVAGSTLIETQLRLARATGEPVVFNGQFAAVTELEALDICVLGRDVTGMFAVIVDQRANLVCLLRERHRYTIEEV